MLAGAIQRQEEETEMHFGAAVSTCAGLCISNYAWRWFPRFDFSVSTSPAASFPRALGATPCPGVSYGLNILPLREMQRKGLKASF